MSSSRSALLLIKLFLRLVDRALARSQLASGTAKFIRGGIKALLLTLLVLTEASQLGIPITSFVALLSVVGVAVSLAVQDGLKNIAGALLIHTARPFVLGDLSRSATSRARSRRSARWPPGC